MKRDAFFNIFYNLEIFKHPSIYPSFPPIPEAKQFSNVLPPCPNPCPPKNGGGGGKHILFNCRFPHPLVTDEYTLGFLLLAKGKQKKHAPTKRRVYLFLTKVHEPNRAKKPEGWFGGQEGNKSTCFSGTEKQRKKIGKYHQQKIVATPKAYSIVSNRATQTHTYTKATWKSIDICVKIKYIYRKTWQTTCGISPPLPPPHPPPPSLHQFPPALGFPIFRLPALPGRNAGRMWGASVSVCIIGCNKVTSRRC